MRDYGRFDGYYEELIGDIYPQPQEHDLHFFWADEIIQWWMRIIHPKNVLDVGCGDGFCQELFKKAGIDNYLGISLGEDVQAAQLKMRNVVSMDFNFLEFPDRSFDFIFARHALEHSPFPIITLMEWHRVSSKWLGIIVPRVVQDSVGFIGRNHYSVMENQTQIRWLLRRAGWIIISKDHIKEEYRYLCVKLPRIGYEGWAEVPLTGIVHDADRDDTL